MSSLDLMPPHPISLETLVRESHLIVIARRLDDDPQPGFSARYRVNAVVWDAYHAANPQHHIVQPGQELVPLSPDVEAQAQASQHLAELYAEGISASVCVAPSAVYHSSLPAGERDCLLFLQPIVHADKVECMLAAFNAVESLTMLDKVRQVLGPAATLALRAEVVAALNPPSYRLVKAFYTCFSRRDPVGMVAAYHAEVDFCDPVFGDLHGREALALWPMFLERAPTLELSFLIISADQTMVRARYHPRYVDAETGRRIENDITSEFTIRDDKIIRHEDSFSLGRFAAMALGPQGRLVSLWPPLRRAIRAKARADLAGYLRDCARRSGSAGS